jgi:hypothetical protein
MGLDRGISSCVTLSLPCPICPQYALWDHQSTQKVTNHSYRLCHIRCGLALAANPPAARAWPGSTASYSCAESLPHHDDRRLSLLFEHPHPADAFRFPIERPAKGIQVICGFRHARRRLWLVLREGLRAQVLTHGMGHSSPPISVVSITLVSSLPAGSARTLLDGSSGELPIREPTGVVGVTCRATPRGHADSVGHRRRYKPPQSRNRSPTVSQTVQRVEKVGTPVRGCRFLC